MQGGSVRRDREAPAPAYGYLESVLQEGRRVHVSCWMLDLRGPFEELAVECEGGRIDVERMASPDLHDALGGVPGSARARFHFVIDTRALDLRDEFHGRVVGRRNGRAAAVMAVDLHRPRVDLPPPPRWVMRRAAGNENPDFWFASGMQTANDLVRVLEERRDRRSVERLLDWGCGAGQVTRHLIDRLPDTVVYGHDIDREAVEWAGRNLAGCFSPCGLEPPLAHPEGLFDVVVAGSVFTHLTRASQAAWLIELRRVLQPGGLLLATTHGRHAARWHLRDPALLDRLERDGIVDELRDEGLGQVASGDYYRSTFQTEEYTRSTWGELLELLACRPGGYQNLQDLWILRRPPAS